MRRGGKGQSTLEYILVVSAILAILIAGVHTALTPAVESTIREAGSVASEAVKKIDGLVN